MKHFIYFTLLFFFYSPAFSQINVPVEFGLADDAGIMATPKLKRGIYQNFNELKKNAPSILEGFQESAEGNIIIKHQIRMDNQKIKNAYGFSDGESIFINARYYNGGVYYVKLETLGHYALIREEAVRNHALSDQASASSISHFGEYPYRAYMLNMETGYIEELTRKKMKQILANDPELLQAYTQEDKPSSFDVYKKYIQAHNQKTVSNR